jgi:hypothetical protein
MTSRITRTASDGRVVERVATAARVAGTTGFEGKWKELGDAGALGKDPKTDSPASQLASQSGQPSWVISTSSDGVISWYVPATGELIRGKADGQPRPITGPQIPAGTTFVWKQISPYQLEFYASGDGRLREAAVEILAPDGKTFTDKLWKAGHEDEKDVTVYVKR